VKDLLALSFWQIVAWSCCGGSVVLLALFIAFLAVEGMVGSVVGFLDRRSKRKHDARMTELFNRRGGER